MNRVLSLVVVLGLAYAPVPALAWAVIAPNKAVAVAKSTLTVTPATEWNRGQVRPSKKGELWTRDGATLNELMFFGGIAAGEPLLRERSKKDQPLPKFAASMLPTDIVRMIEDTTRIQLKTSLFDVKTAEPTAFGGQPGFRMRYRYVVQGDNLARVGEARWAIVGGKLYMISFVAPQLHYFERDIATVRALMDSARIG